jgi:four helix bundle protein
MDKADLERRTKAFALRVIGFVGSLPKDKAADVLGYQVLKSGTAVGANYREANRAESRKDFIHKIGIVEKEASETQYWLELLEESHIGSAPDRQWLLRESGQLVAIFTRVGKTAKSNIANSPLKDARAKIHDRGRQIHDRNS